MERFSKGETQVTTITIISFVAAYFHSINFDLISSKLFKWKKLLRISVSMMF